MEQEGPIKVKALTALFQEEARIMALDQAQARDRPAIAEKPRRLPPAVPVGRCCLLTTPVHRAVENSTMPVVPKVIFRDGTRLSGGKHPIPFSSLVMHATPPKPPSPPHQDTHHNGRQNDRQNKYHYGDQNVLKNCQQNSQHNGGVDYAATQSFKDCYISLRQKEHKNELSLRKGVPLQTKCKKKGLMLHHPFKSTKVSKVGGELTEETTYAGLTTTRDSGGPVEGSVMNAPKAENGDSLQVDYSSSEGPPSSPDILITPPMEGQGEDSSAVAGTAQFFGTLEKAKKRFSPKHLLVYAKSKSLRSNGVHHLPDHSSSTNRGVYLPSTDQERCTPESMVPAAVPKCPPHIVCVPARPFFKRSVSSRSSTSESHFAQDKAGLLPVRPDGLPVPPRKPLPDRVCLGPSPVKPPRPPWVYLSCYQATTEHAKELSTEIEPVACVDPDPAPPSIVHLELVAPEFPDFELNLELDTAEATAFNLADLELEATEFGRPDSLADLRVPGFLVQEHELPSFEPPEIPSFDHHALMVSRHHDIIHPDPGILPDQPFLEFWDQTPKSSAPVVDQQVVAESSAEVESVKPTENFNHNSASVVNEDIQLQSRVFHQENYYETYGGVYEVVQNIDKLTRNQNSRKQKVPPKNPYGTPHPMKEETRLNIWPRNSCKERPSPENQEDKEQKKREKHRLEKEKKEQKEREKKENEMKKKFKVTGQEEPMYHARVSVACKLQKNDLPVKTGDTVSIIRTTSCPKGKWLVRNTNHKYGYISVMNVELNIKEMLELGKKAQAAGRGGNADGDTISVGSRASNHYPLSNNSFTDDDDEWTLEEDNISPSLENRIHNRTVSMPDMLCSQPAVQHTLSDGSIDDLHTQARHEALQKLAIFFHQDKDDTMENEESTCTSAEAPSILFAVEEPQYSGQDVDFADVELLPPPDLYADTM
ncbi:hypothetical protein UPYG_G00293170 [Umbra pygmaea]|uniref:Helically-extended SH3 domain-containing protein n=1 Tax=Umbra pygmaea TaxID=75934 RepID=A0ABD0WPQ1_UMBPY